MNNLVIEVIHIQILCLIIGVLPIVISWRYDRIEALILFSSATGVSVAAYYWLPERLHVLSSDFSVVNNLMTELSDLYPQLLGSRELISALLSAGMGVLISWSLLMFFMMQRSKNKPIRGTVLLSNADMIRKIKPPKNKLPIKIGRIPLPYNMEARTIIVSGEPGVGKTQMIMSLISAARKRGDRGFCVDVGGDLMSMFWREGDIILDPSDERSVKSSPFADIEDEHDCDSVAGSYVSEGNNKSGEWNLYTKNLAADMLRTLWLKGKRKNKDIYYYVAKASTAEFKELVAGTPSERIFDDGNEKMLASILTILSIHFSVIQFLDQEAGEDSFSLRNWVKSASDKSWVWIGSNGRTEKSLKPYRRASIDMFVREVLSLKPDHSRNIWAILDEFPSHGELKVTLDAAARGRKHGLGMVLGIQSISQINSIYGHDDAQSILACAAHSLILRTPDPDTNEYLSKSIGDVERRREQINLDGNKNVTSRQQVIEIRRAVLASEISNLPTLKGYLKISGIGWTLVSIPVISKKLNQKIEPYVPCKAYLGLEKQHLSNLSSLEVKLINQLDEV